MEGDLFELYIMYRQEKKLHFKLVKVYNSRVIKDRASLILLSCNISRMKVNDAQLKTKELFNKRKQEAEIDSLSHCRKSKKPRPPSPSSNHSRSTHESSTRRSSRLAPKDAEETLFSRGYKVGLIKSEELRGSGFEPVYGFNVLQGRRLKDGLNVFVRIVSSDSTELEILKKFNQSDLRAHPRNIIIPVLEFIPSLMGDIVYVVMEAGESALDVVSSDLLDYFVNFTNQLFKFFIQKSHLVDGIKFLNEFGIVHHDVKPANLVFLHGSIYLIDLEFAKVYQQGEKEEVIVGTKSFIPSNLERLYNPFEKEEFAVQKTIECLQNKVAASAEP